MTQHYINVTGFPYERRVPDLGEVRFGYIGKRLEQSDYVLTFFSYIDSVILLIVILDGMTLQSYRIGHVS